jgi:hypothetical protein
MSRLPTVVYPPISEREREVARELVENGYAAARCVVDPTGHRRMTVIMVLSKVKQEIARRDAGDALA